MFQRHFTLTLINSGPFWLLYCQVIMKNIMFMMELRPEEGQKLKIMTISDKVMEPQPQGKAFIVPKRGSQSYK